MITINGKKYAKNDAEFIDTLFQGGGTAHGFYKTGKNGIKLFDHKKNLFAFVVNNRHNEQFFVDASIKPDGKSHYMFGTSSLTEKILGITGCGQARELAQEVIRQAQ